MFGGAWEMLSQISAVSDNYRIEKWDLLHDLGTGFETIVFNILTKQLSEYYSLGAKIYPTPATRDDGKDFIITTSVELHDILNHSFSLGEKKHLKIFLECKSTNNERLSLERILGSVSRIKEENPDYYVLVTNASVSPFSYYRIKSELDSADISFVFVDQHILLDILNKSDTAIGIPPMIDTPEYAAEYQTLSGKTDGRNVYELYIFCRNFTPNEHLGGIQLLTDRNWNADEPKINFIIEPYGSYIRKIIIERAYSDGIEDLLFQIKVDTNESQVRIRGTDTNFVFETSLIGNEHLKYIDALSDYIIDADGVELHNIWGDAGVGKTRVFTEVFKRLDGRNLDFGFFTIGKNNRTFFERIKKFLIKGNYINQNSKQCSFSALIGECSNEYRRAVLLLDDLHNAEPYLLDELKLILELPSPVTVILCGRTDFSGGSVEYYSFTQWCRETENVRGFILNPLSPQETKTMIQSIICSSPNEVTEKIQKLSRNVPLFIVQCVEYFLEQKIVTIIDRNTVGIINVATFSSKTYIPSEMHKIYEMRLEFLLSQEQGSRMDEYLLVLSFLGGKQTQLDAIRFFDEDTALLDKLHTLRFIIVGEDGGLSFVHESLYLFFRKRLNTDRKLQKRVAEIITVKSKYLLKRINQWERGQLAYWHGEKDLAKTFFSESVAALREVKNYSSFNIDIGVYDYLYTVFALYKANSKEHELLGKILTARIYIALHHHTPTKAIEDCDRALDLIEKTPILRRNDILKNTVLEQKAHSIINAGNLADGSLLLNKLLSRYLALSEEFAQNTIFDMFDRLCGLYNKYNCMDMSESFNALAFREAHRAKDINLLALAHYNRAKRFFYNNYEEAAKSLSETEQLLSDGSSERILCACEISVLMLNLLHGNCKDGREAMKSCMLLLKKAVNNAYPNSIIRAYLTLAVCAFLDEKRGGTYLGSKEFIEKGIDCSIRFGVPAHIWQFYNLLGIIQINMRENADTVMRTFETIYALLRKENLLHLGNLDICYGNILALSNIGFFWQTYGFESEFYRKMALVTYFESTRLCDFDCTKPACDYVCPDSIENIKKEYENAKLRQPLFAKSEARDILRDAHSDFFIIMS
jgi:hypothetical protein